MKPEDNPKSADADKSELKTVKPGGPKKRNGFRILIVDDAKFMRTLLSKTLDEEGYDTSTAESGTDALKRFAAEGADMIIMDIKMKDMDGIEALKELRKKHDRAQLPILMATAQGETDEVVAAFKAGANDYVKKPISFPILFARMETQLQLKKMIAQLRGEIDRAGES